MSDDPIQVGDRVTWRVKGRQRIGKVIQFLEWSSYAYVKPDEGNLHFVHKARLTKVEDAPAQDEAVTK